MEYYAMVSLRRRKFNSFSSLGVKNDTGITIAFLMGEGIHNPFPLDRGIKGGINTLPSLPYPGEENTIGGSP